MNGVPVWPFLLGLCCVSFSQRDAGDEVWLAQRVQKGRPGQFLVEMPFKTWLYISARKGLPRWSSGKESTCQCRRFRFNLWVGKIPWRRKWQPTPVLLPGKSHGWRSLAGYSPWGCKELDRTEHIRTHTHTHTLTHTHLSFGLSSSLKLKWPLSSFAPSVQFQSISSCSCLSACQDLTDERMFYAFSISFIPLTDINHQMPRSGKHMGQNTSINYIFKAPR